MWFKWENVSSIGKLFFFVLCDVIGLLRIREKFEGFRGLIHFLQIHDNGLDFKYSISWDYPNFYKHVVDNLLHKEILSQKEKTDLIYKLER